MAEANAFNTAVASSERAGSDDEDDDEDDEEEEAEISVPASEIVSDPLASAAA